VLISRLSVVLTWALLLVPGAEAAEDAPAGTAGVRRIELRADTRASPPEVRIRPGYSTTLFFDSPILPEQVELEGRERFQRVGMADDHLALIPSSELRQGERLRLRVRFRDQALPELASLMLVVDFLQVEQQVELYRHPRTAESYRQEVEELKAGVTRLRQEVEQLRGVQLPAREIEALLGSLENRDTLRFESLVHQRVSSPSPTRVIRGSVLSLEEHWTALRFRLEMPFEEVAWTAAGASLTDAQGRLIQTRPPWQPGPVRMNQAQIIVVLIEEAVALRAGRYTLKLWDEAGRTVTIEGVTSHG
jgi:uncharacterized protein (TIGR02268 family)